MAEHSDFVRPIRFSKSSFHLDKGESGKLGSVVSEGHDQGCAVLVVMGIADESGDCT